MADLTAITRDRQKATEGGWIPFFEDLEFKIASAATNDYKKAIAKKTKPFVRKIRAGTVDEQELNYVTAPVIAKYLLLDWKGLTENGEEVPYSVEKATELLRNPDLLDLRLFVLEEANTSENFRVDLLEDSEKNS